MPVPDLIAHRGAASHYPENTLLALEAAVQAGAAFVEFDVQMSADGVPVVIHDATLQRTAGLPQSVLDSPWSRLREVCVGEPTRLGDRFADARIPALSQVMAWLAGHPGVHAFVEVKRESLERFGTAPVVEAVMAQLAPLAGRTSLISFAPDALRFAAGRGAGDLGWVLPEWSGEAQRIAAALQPRYLFCDVRRLPADAGLWPGPWQWAVYEVADPAYALTLAGLGVAYVESMAVEALLQVPELAARAREAKARARAALH